MCKFIAIINKQPNNTQIINNILSLNEEHLSHERDGYSVYEWSNGKGLTRNFPDYSHYQNIVENIQYRGSEIYICHFRTMTSGSMGEDGLHLQKLNNRYVYAHNGSIWQYARREDKSDSHHFFQDMVNNGINYDIVSKYLDKTNFWGRAVVFDEQERELHAFNTMSMYSYALEDCILFTSFELELEFQSIEQEEVLGMTFIMSKNAEKIPIIAHEEIRDDYYFKFKDGLLTEENLIYKYSEPIKTGLQKEVNRIASKLQVRTDN